MSRAKVRIPDQLVEPLYTQQANLLLSMLLIGYCSRWSLPLPALPARASQRERRAVFAEYQGLFGSRHLFSAELADSEIPEWGIDLLGSRAKESLESICYLFESLLSRGACKRRGIFYTPMEIVRALVAECLDGHEARAPALLDPACGSGLFLLEAYRTLAGRSGGSAGRLAEILRSIHGVDLDARAAELAGVVLRLEHISRAGLCTAEPKIRVGDSLIAPEDLQPFGAVKEAIAALSFEREFPDALERGGFDCIVGNPPYGLSRGEQLSPFENRILKALYTSYRAGKVNKYILFIARSFQLLRQGGRMALIVPNAWLGIEGGRPIRAALLAQGSLARLTEYRYSVFRLPSVEAVSFRVEKGARKELIEVYEQSSPEQPRSLRFAIPTRLCREDPESRIPLRWDAGTEEILAGLAPGCVPLGHAGSPFRPMIALQAYAAGRGTPAQDGSEGRARAYHCARCEDDSCLPYLEGSDVVRYGLRWSGQYLRHGPWLAEPQTLERFDGPRVVVREILGAPPYVLSACYVDHAALYNKSILHVLPRSEVGRSGMYALCALLNSRFASFLVLRLGRKSQRRLFPKIVNADLKALPIPRDFAARSGRLGELARARHAAPPAGSALSALEEQIEAEIAALYGCAGRSRMVLERFLELPGAYTSSFPGDGEASASAISGATKPAASDL